MKKTALVLGATGMVGQQLVAQLMEDDHYQTIHILSRREWAAPSSKLVVHIVDFDQLTTSSDLFKVNDIYCCLGTTMANAGSKEAFYRVDYTYIVSAGRLGRQQGAQQFLLISSIGADASSSAYYTKTKGQTEDALKGLDYPALHIFRPSFLDGDRVENRLGERLGIGLTKLINQLGLLKTYQPVKASAVARAMRKAAQQNNAGNKLYDNLQIVSLGRQKNEQ